MLRETFNALAITTLLRALAETVHTLLCAWLSHFLDGKVRQHDLLHILDRRELPVEPLRMLAE